MGDQQATPPAEPSVIDRMIDPVSRCFDVESAKKLVELPVDPVVQERVAILAEKANEGLLTDEERAAYEAYINTDDFIAILKLKAQAYLATSGGWKDEPSYSHAVSCPDDELQRLGLIDRSRC
jgi:hypothetical protein